MFQFILFDLDNTLFDFNKAEANALSRMLTDIGVTPTPEMIHLYSKINLSQWKRLELGEIDREQVKIGRYEIFFHELHINFPAKEAARIYENYLGIGHFFIDGAPELLEYIASIPDYQMYLVTNGTKSVQDGRLKSADISHYFKKIFISEEVGYNKPSLEYFNICFSQIPDFDKRRAVIIGDSITSDIKGGILAGIKTIWFNPSKSDNKTEWIPDYEIHDLSELKDIL